MKNKHNQLSIFIIHVIIVEVKKIFPDKQDLSPSLRCLKISCLEQRKEVLLEELEPLGLCDVLLEEGAIKILHHDNIIEIDKREKQIKYLLDHIKENKNDCFQAFLYTLQKENYEVICKELERPVSKVVATGMFKCVNNLASKNGFRFQKPLVSQTKNNFLKY